MDLNGLDLNVLERIGKDWNGLEWIGMDRNGLEWIGMDRNGLDVVVDIDCDDIVDVVVDVAEMLMAL